MNKQLLHFISLLLIATTLILMPLYLMKSKHYILNTTSSYPLGLYQISQTEEYQRGDLVSFCAPHNKILVQMVERGYAPKDDNCPEQMPKLLKKIMALENDTITLNQNVKINDSRIPKSHIFSHDTKGNPLPTQPSQTIQEGYFWAMSDYHERSFDSRYFGQVPLCNIVGVAIPIIVWR